MYTGKLKNLDKSAVIHQPDFLPYLGFFHRLLDVEILVLLDDVQFQGRGKMAWQNRDKIKTPNGERWLTVAVMKCPMSTMINEVLLSNNIDWRTANLNLINENYRNAPYYEEVMPHIIKLYGFECEKLIDFSLESIRMLLYLFNINIKIILSSSLKVISVGNERLVDILKSIGARKYLSGVGARTYLDTKMFNAAGIEVKWQAFKHPEYPQLHGAFIPYLSSIDILFNCGIQESRNIIRK